MSLNETIPSRKYSITARKVLLYVLMMKPLSHCNILLLTRKLFYITPICERSPRQTTCLLWCCKKYSRKLLLLMIWHPYVMPVWIIWVCNIVTRPVYWRWHASWNDVHYVKYRKNVDYNRKIFNNFCVFWYKNSNNELLTQPISHCALL